MDAISIKPPVGDFAPNDPQLLVTTNAGTGEVVSRQLTWLPPDGTSVDEYRVIVHRVIGSADEPDEFIGELTTTDIQSEIPWPLPKDHTYTFVIQTIIGIQPPSMIIIEDIIR